MVFHHFFNEFSHSVNISQVIHTELLALQINDELLTLKIVSSAICLVVCILHRARNYCKIIFIIQLSVLGQSTMSVWSWCRHLRDCFISIIWGLCDGCCVCTLFGWQTFSEMLDTNCTLTWLIIQNGLIVYCGCESVNHIFLPYWKLL
jgi:hypothetical protein